MNIEAKVQAGTGAAFVAGIVIWALQTWVFKGSTVPAGLVSLIYAVVPALLAGVAGYMAPHTPRPAPAAPPPAQDVPPPAA